ncbi:MAG TPA: MogA/MoaB family molybdenum cofactor biosynthesis protein [Candidatus Dormibacteraeota bacterium]|jgi:molybdenum cofactor synthesis domain-containing protein|nr:MogA/MoaB family molybdenum cofactor biosynthesis protein [Candidatus Dormibacteraeota bacterium]
MSLRVAIVTVSDSVSQGKRQDQSGPAVSARCSELGWKVISTHVVSDDSAVIQVRLRDLAESAQMDLIVTTGGTGIGPRDSTPEATAAACEKLIPGLGEMMRQKGMQATPRAALSRGVVGVRGRTLILNLPGKPQGAVDSLNAIAELLPHAVEVLGGSSHD